MSYLFKAAETMGIYFTPSRVLAMGYGDGKTTPPEYIAGNPPFTTRIRCPRCKGNGTLYNTDGQLTLCPACLGAGEIEARPIEAVTDDYAQLMAMGDLGGAELS